MKRSTRRRWIWGVGIGAVFPDRRRRGVLVWFRSYRTLLVREMREGYTDSDTVIGDVHYEERYELQLQSLEPMR